MGCWGLKNFYKQLTWLEPGKFYMFGQNHSLLDYQRLCSVLEKSLKIYLASGYTEDKEFFSSLAHIGSGKPLVASHSNIFDNNDSSICSKLLILW